MLVAVSNAGIDRGSIVAPKALATSCLSTSAGEAGVVAFDIMATNGVVHIVNSVF